MQSRTQKQVWIAMTVGIAGLIAGYAIVIARQPIDVFARMNSCPLRHMEGTCDCTDGSACDTGECAHRV